MGRAPTELTSATLQGMRAVLTRLDDRYRIEDRPQFASLVNYSAKADEPVHRWFRYREGYSPDLVDILLRSTSTGQLLLDPFRGAPKLVLDPFCGAGTTLLAASRLGYRSLGIDANPLSVFISQVKTRKYSLNQLDGFMERCSPIARLRQGAPADPKPRLSIIDKVFLPDVLDALLVTKHFINHSLTREARDFVFLAWLSILEEVSNVYKEGNGIKYRNRKRTRSGYQEIPIEVWADSAFPSDRFRHVLDVLVNRVRLMISDARSSEYGEYKAEIFEGDALALDDFVEPGSVEFACFSPPYANNFNYFKAHKVELWMGGFVSSYADLQELTRRSLRSHVETGLWRDGDTFGWYPEELDELLHLIAPEHLWSDRIPQAVRGYFHDMRTVLEKLHGALRLGCRCVIVVGNSAYGGVVIPTDALLAEMARAQGFEIDRIAVARHLTTSSQQKRALEPVRQHLRESLLFLRKRKAHRERPSRGYGERGYRHVSELPRFPTESPNLVYVIRNQGLTDLTHGMHKYPSKFIPQVPRWAIRKYLGGAKGRIVLDPFVGSGTTLVEAFLGGHYAYGIDVDPLARLISKVKTTPIDRRKLSETVDQVITEVQTRTSSRFRPQIDTLSHWFTPEASRDLGIIRETIEQWRKHEDLYDFLIVCLSAIVRKVSNADNQSLKTYVSGTHKKTAEPAKALFLTTLQHYATRLAQFTEAAPPTGGSVVMSAQDAREFADQWRHLGLPPADLAVTSPPYIKTIDYVYNQMVEYFWIGDLFGLQNQARQNEHKRHYIGTEKVRANEYRDFTTLDCPAVADIVDRLRHRNAKHAYIVNRYFADLQTHFRQIGQVLDAGAVYVMVLGDSSVSDIEIPTHILVPQVAGQEGFELEQQFAYEIRNRYMRFPRKGHGGVVKYDWVVSLRNLGD